MQLRCNMWQSLYIQLLQSQVLTVSSSMFAIVAAFAVGFLLASLCAWCYWTAQKRTPEEWQEKYEWTPEEWQEWYEDWEDKSYQDQLDDECNQLRRRRYESPGTSEN
jgi:hypothetical protein